MKTGEGRDGPETGSNRQKKAPETGAFLFTLTLRLAVADVHSYFETETHV